MPKVTMRSVSETDAGDYLREVIGSGDHWVFVTDSEEGAEQFAVVATTVAMGYPPDGTLACGRVTWLAKPSGRQSRVSFLVVRKADVPWLAKALRELNKGDEQDVIVLSAEAERLAGFVVAVTAGEARMIPVGNQN